MSATTSRFRIGWRVGLPYLRRYRWAYLLGFLLLALTNGFQVAIPWLLKLGIDSIEGLESDPAAMGTVGWAALGILVAAVLQAVARVASRWVVFRAGRDAEYDLRRKAYDHLLLLDPAFYRSRSRGDLVSRLSNDINNARLLFGFAILNVANTIFAYAGALSIMLSISWWMTLLALAPFPPVMWFLRHYGGRLHQRFVEAQEKLGDLSGFLQESLQGYEVVKGFAQEPGFLEGFVAKNRANYEANMRLAWTRSLLMPIMIFLGGFGIFIVVGVGGWQVIEGRITIGDFVAFQGYLGMLVWPTLALGWLFNVLERGLASLMRVHEVIETEPAIGDEPGARDVALTGRVEVRPMDVVLRDTAEERGFALRQLGLELSEGDRLAVVGQTGAGKSVLLQALLRLTELPRGMVWLDGVEIHDIRLRHLRRRLGYLPQEPFLAGRTIREVLTVGLEDRLGDDRLWSALEDAAVAAEVGRLPGGLDSRLGVGGISLSGGQRQRLMIARLTLLDPAILLLDDPLSALDFDTADRVRETLERFAEGRTVVWATHRLTGMDWFDEIVLLEAGRVRARGRHEDLLEDGLYRTLYERQQLMRSLDEMPGGDA